MGRPRAKPLNPLVQRLLEAYGLATLPEAKQLARLAEEMDVPEGTVRNWNKRASGVPYARLLAASVVTGRSIDWLAEGVPEEPKATPTPRPRLAHQREPTPAQLRLQEPAVPWRQGSLDEPSLLEQLGQLLARVPPDQREAAAVALAGWAKAGGSEHWRRMFAAAIEATGKRRRAGA